MVMDKFADVKVGDLVMQYTGLSNESVRALTVTRVLKASFEAGGSTRYRKSDGYAQGGHAWNRDCVQPFNAQEYQEARSRMERRRKVNELKAFHWAKLDGSLIDQIHAMLPSPAVEKGGEK
jgi:hypothetical protein